MKLYTAKSSAVRAAKKEGLDLEKTKVMQDLTCKYSEDPNKWYYFVPARTQEPKIEITRKSSIERPTKAVWDIAEELTEKDPSIRRKDVIAECVARGIAYYTARTQYQQWLTATRNSK